MASPQYPTAMRGQMTTPGGPNPGQAVIASLAAAAAKLPPAPSTVSANAKALREPAPFSSRPAASEATPACSPVSVAEPAGGPAGR